MIFKGSLVTSSLDLKDEKHIFQTVQFNAEFLWIYKQLSIYKHFTIYMLYWLTIAQRN